MVYILGMLQEIGLARVIIICGRNRVWRVEPQWVVQCSGARTILLLLLLLLMLSACAPPRGRRYYTTSPRGITVVFVSINRFLQIIQAKRRYNSTGNQWYHFFPGLLLRLDIQWDIRHWKSPIAQLTCRPPIRSILELPLSLPPKCPMLTTQTYHGVREDPVGNLGWSRLCYG